MGAAWLALAAGARGDQYAPPANYYAAATGTGATLKAQLRNIIGGHTVVSYDNARIALQVTDADPTKPGHMLTVYDRTSVNVAAINPGGPIPGWDNADTWNREHTWPTSRGVGTSGPDRSDLFNLRPALTEGNGDRANYNFSGTYGVTPMGLITAPNPDMWYPGDADAGMIARQAFYMAVRYDGADAATTDLELAAGNPAATTGTMGDLNRLLEWHYAAPPDEFERRRNQVIYSQYQGNRNPLTDRPELAWSLFVGQTNDSMLTLAGGSPGASGASTLIVDLGRRLSGAPLPAAQQATLSKAGTAGTYFSVTTSGAALSSLSGSYNAFAMGGPGSRTFAVGLAAGTNVTTPGLRSGTVVIDNLDVTTGGGVGRGANDGNDVVTVQMSVLDHANPSFSGVADVNTLHVDLGTAAWGSAAATAMFEVFNLSTTVGFTAGLDLDLIVGSGDVGALSTTLTTFGGAGTLGAGASRSFQVGMNTTTVGSFAASYTLAFSDEDLPGATSVGTMTLTVSGVVVDPGPSADFNGDGLVDGADLLAWQRGVGLASGATRGDGDADGNGRVDAADLEAWRVQFLSGDASLAAPEPSSAAMLLAGLAAAGWRRKRRR